MRCFIKKERGSSLVNVIVVIGIVAVASYFALNSVSDQMAHSNAVRQQAKSVNLVRSVRSVAMLDIVPTAVANCKYPTKVILDNISGMTVLSFWKVVSNKANTSCASSLESQDFSHAVCFDLVHQDSSGTQYSIKVDFSYRDLQDGSKLKCEDAKNAASPGAFVELTIKPANSDMPYITTSLVPYTP